MYYTKSGVEKLQLPGEIYFVFLQKACGSAGKFLAFDLKGFRLQRSRGV
jgi:hypothetical protein